MLVPCVCGSEIIRTYVFSLDSLNQHLYKETKRGWEVNNITSSMQEELAKAEMQEGSRADEKEEGVTSEKVRNLESQMEHLAQENAKLQRKNAELSTLKVPFILKFFYHPYLINFAFRTTLRKPSSIRNYFMVWFNRHRIF